MSRFERALAILAIVGAPTGAAAQGLGSPSVVLSGMEARGYFFRPGAGPRTVAQVTVPLVAVVPLTRALTADLGTRWAYTRLTTYAGGADDLTGLTDTQLRLGYTIGRDVALASIVASLPTGRRTVSSDKFAVVGSLGSDFLTLPVSSYGAGTSLTAGLATTRRFGGLNVGVGASARWSGSYSPFNDVQIVYKPGFEDRIQIAGDGLLASGRLSGALTYSTFGSDNFTSPGGTTVSQAYTPGGRVIGELSYEAVVGEGTLTAFGWDFHRSAGDAGTGVIGDNSENIANLGAKWSVATSDVVTWAPQLDIRQWSQRGSLVGRMGGLQLRMDVAATAGLAIQSTGRMDWGFITSASAERVTVQGWSFGVLLRRNL